MVGYLIADDDQTVGVFLHSIFQIPGWGLRDAGFAGWKGCIDWARRTGYNACTLALFPAVRQEHPDWTLAEARRLYHSVLGSTPRFGAGDLYYPPDPAMATPQVLRRHELRQRAVAYAAEVGLRPHLILPITVGSPAFGRAHPELRSPAPSDFCQEGMVLSPLHAEAADHLLDLWRTAVQAHPRAAGFMLWHGDPGSSNAPDVAADPTGFAHFLQRVCDMIRGERPEARITLAGWGLDDRMVSELAAVLPDDVAVTEPPLIHSQFRSEQDHLERIATWQRAGLRVQQWLEVQENPTILLPQCYPRRIERAMRAARSQGVRDVWACSAFYTHVFNPHFRIVAELAHGSSEPVMEIVARVLKEALGADAVADGLAWAEAAERVWSLFYSAHQRAAGFNWPWHMAFPGGLLPPTLLREPASPALLRDTEALVAAGEEALEAAQRMAAHTWVPQPLATNVILVSTELLLIRARFRLAKLPLLEAIRSGDLGGAVAAFEPLPGLAEELIATAASAPNTAVLNDHWTKLALLPERLSAMRDHLPELVANGRMRDPATV